MNKFNGELVDLIKKHLGEHKEKTLNTRLKVVHTVNHKLMHLEEIVIVVLVAFLSLMLAHHTGLPGADEYMAQSGIGDKLNSAISNLSSSADARRIVAQREAHPSVNNSAYPGYCTHMVRVITPEIFPYISDNEQEAVFYGNAKDYCANAKAAGLDIGLTPKENSLVVYKPGNGYSSYGHVEKVVYIDSNIQKMITLGGNRVGKYVYSYYIDSYADNSSIDCFIYPTATNQNNQIPEKVLTQLFPDVSLAPSAIIETSVEIIPVEELGEPVITPTEEPEIVVENQEIGVEPDPVEIEVEMPEVIVPVVTSPEDIVLDTSGVSPQAAHFLTQRDLSVDTNVHTSAMNVGEVRSIALVISKKGGSEKYSGILPVPVSLVASNNNIQTDYSYLQLINNGSATVNLTAKKSGESTLLVQLGGVTIGKIKVSIK